MSNELIKKDFEIANKIDEETIKRFLFGSNTKLTEQEQAMFMGIALRNNLDPFKREIYVVKYGSNFNVITGYQTYIQRAEATGLLDGWKVEHIKEGDKIVGARITIYRKDFNKPFEWEVSMSEFNTGQSSWKKMPGFMIKKVAIAQGFRLAFPNALGGLPYTADELPIEEPKPVKAEVVPEPSSGGKKSWAEIKEELKPILPLAREKRIRVAELIKIYEACGGDILEIEEEINKR